MTSAQVIEQIGVRSARAAPKDSRVVLFGSHAREQADDGSDYDVLVIEPEVEDAAREAVRCGRSWAICSFRLMWSWWIGIVRCVVRLCAGRWSSARCVTAAFLPTPEELEVAGLLLCKAASDLSAARALAADSHQQDDVVGFDAQQAVQKSLKAVLALRGLEIPRTHDGRALDPPGRHSPGGGARRGPRGGAAVPVAVAMRYDEMDAVLDRAAALRIAGASVQWANGQLDAAQTERPDSEGGEPPAA